MAYVHIGLDRESAAIELAEFITALSAWDIHHKGTFSVALSGGATPRLLYQILAAPPYLDQIAWDRWHVFWSDERCVPMDHPESNRKVAQDALLGYVAIPPENIHAVDVAADPGVAADDYASQITTLFETESPSFDLVLLGVGADGHTASLLPGANTSRETERLVVAETASELPRVTFSLPLINAARTVTFLATGAEKAQVVKEIIEPEGDAPTFPAALVRAANDEPHWFIDREAARLIKSEGL